MSPGLSSLLRFFLLRSRLCLLPVRVRSGIAAGARWTLYPCSAYWRGTHEPAMQAGLVALGDVRGWSCWDLGAHFGLYSVGLARRVGPSGVVAAFEPSPDCFARLVRHRRMNRLDWLQPIQAAVSDTPGTAEFYNYGDPQSTTAHLPYEQETRVAAAKPISVATVVLDDLVAQGKLRAPRFIKVDVEGHGHRALAGARRTLAGCRPLLVVAFHSAIEVRGVLDVLTPLGYTHEEINTRSGSTDPMIGRDFWFRPPSQ